MGRTKREVVTVAPVAPVEPVEDVAVAEVVSEPVESKPVNPNATVAIVTYKVDGVEMTAEYSKELHGCIFMEMARETAKKVGGKVVAY